MCALRACERTRLMLLFSSNESTRIRSFWPFPLDCIVAPQPMPWLDGQERAQGGRRGKRRPWICVNGSRQAERDCQQGRQGRASEGHRAQWTVKRRATRAAGGIGQSSASPGAERRRHPVSWSVLRQATGRLPPPAWRAVSNWTMIARRLRRSTNERGGFCCVVIQSWRLIGGMALVALPLSGRIILGARPCHYRPAALHQSGLDNLRADGRADAGCCSLRRGLRVCQRREPSRRGDEPLWKTAYLRDSAKKSRIALDLETLAALPDEDVIKALVTVKGIGRWSAEMFLIFRLHRPDVLPVGDLGIVTAAARVSVAQEADTPSASEDRRGVAAVSVGRVRHCGGASTTSRWRRRLPKITKRA